MKKYLKITTRLICLFSFLHSTSYSQYYSPDPSQTAGPVEGKVNIILLSDGYLSSDQELFHGDVQDFYREFVITPPFKDYIYSFNIFGFFVASEDNGPHHPGTLGTVCEQNSPPLTTDHETAFGSSLDNVGLHRALICDYDVVTTFITNEQLNNYSIFPLVLVKTDQFGGAANIDLGIATTAARYSYDIEPGQYNAYFDERVAIHELGHSFGRLQDEYFFPCPFTTQPECDAFNTAPNRTNNSDISDDDHIWNHWENVPTSPLIGSFPYNVINQCPTLTSHYFQYGTLPGFHEFGNILYLELVQDIYKPTTLYECYMEKITRPFCAVCREALVMRIYEEVDPINSFTPDNNGGIEYSLSSSQNYELNLTIPVRSEWGTEDQYKSMEVTWEIFEESDLQTAIFTNEMEDPTSVDLTTGEFFYSLTNNSICDLFDEWDEGSYQIKATIHDKAGLTDNLTDNTRWVRHPLADHTWNVTWNVHYNGIAGTDLYAEDIAGDEGVELSSGSFNLWSSPDIWLCNVNNSDCVQPGEPPSYDGPGAEAQINLLVKNRGCKMFDANEDHGTVTFWWAKAKTNLEWPYDWDGDEIVPSWPLEGNQIDSPVNLTEDLDISNT